MAAPKVLIVLGSGNDLTHAEDGLRELEGFGIPYTLRIASAHRTPAMLASIMEEFEAGGGRVYICGAGMSAHLAGVVASLSTLPVIAVPIHRNETAGLDALLSMGQMPRGVPVATMSFGKHGFINAAVFTAQILAESNGDLARKLTTYRESMRDTVKRDDAKNRKDFNG